MTGRYGEPSEWDHVELGARVVDHWWMEWLDPYWSFGLEPR